MTSKTRNSKIMTPYQKAKQLADKFSIVGLQQRNEGIACAIIAVDEIMNMSSKAMMVYIYSEDGTQILNQYPERTYWFWVKQELENL